MEYFIGLDIGTSAVKGALMSVDGVVVTTAQAAFTYTVEGTAKLLDPDDPFRNVGIRLVYQIADRIDHRFTLGLNVLTMFIKLQDADETVNP